MQKELDYLINAVEDPKRPLTALIGGAKVSTKLPVLESLMNKCDKLLLGGGMIFTFYKALGYNVGSSMVEESQVDLAGKLMEDAKSKGVELVLPTDVVIADKFEADANTKISNVKDIPDGWMGLDIGPDSIAEFENQVKSSRTIVWNGPMGVFEMDAFAKGTNAMAHAMAKATEENDATTIVGGGVCVAAVKKTGLGDKMSHISTGGGASLELLEGKTLPGVAALDDA